MYDELGEVLIRHSNVVFKFDTDLQAEESKSETGTWKGLFQEEGYRLRDLPC